VGQQEDFNELVSEDDGRRNPLMAEIRRLMRKYSIPNLERDGDSTASTLARMAWNALRTPISLGDKTFCLKDIPAADRRAEMEFVVDGPMILGETAIAVDGGTAEERLFNGKIDLLVRPEGQRGPVYVVDWKTNSLVAYDGESVRRSMEENGYPLQYMLYALAVRQWLGDGQPAGVAYLYVRGGEQDAGFSGVYGEPLDAQAAEQFRNKVRQAMGIQREE
jgi:ATP-dependent exoDNAse (exonuclease V) beta subunit